MNKAKYNVIYVIVLLTALSTIFVINSGIFRAQNIISEWDNDLEGWVEIDPNDFANIDAINLLMEIQYDWRDTNNGNDWFMVKKVFCSRNWASYEGIAIRLVVDGSDTKFRVMIKDNDEWWVTGNTERELQPLDFTRWKWIIINFADFKQDTLSPIGDNYFNLGSILEIGLNFWDSTTQRGVVYFDEIQLIHFEWWRQNLPIIVGIVSIDIVVAVCLTVYIFNVKDVRRNFQETLKFFKQ